MPFTRQVDQALRPNPHVADSIPTAITQQSKLHDLSLPASSLPYKPRQQWDGARRSRRFACEKSIVVDVIRPPIPLWLEAA
jgi:hypothetical protein